MKRLMAVWAVSLGSVAAHASATSYLCITDHETGFSFDKSSKRWETTNFKPSMKFIISPSSTANSKWMVKSHGDEHPSAACGNDFDEHGNLYCDGFYEVRMNRDNLRFLTIHKSGYWSEKKTKEGESTPALMIGKCSAL